MHTRTVRQDTLSSSKAIFDAGCSLPTSSTVLQASTISARGVDVPDPSVPELDTQGISPMLSHMILIPPVC